VRLLLLQVLQQVQDLRSYGDVEGGGRLVGHDERGIEREGSGDRHPLALAAAQLVRVAAQHPGRQPDHLQQVAHPLPGVGGARVPVDPQWLGHRVGDDHARIEGAVGVLEHHLEVRPEAPERLLGQGDQVGASEHHHPRRHVDQAEQGPPGGGLAAPRLAHDAQCLAARDLEAHAVHRPKGGSVPERQLGAEGKVDLEVTDDEERLSALGRCPAW
jgi:hypothetical protein